MERMIFEVNVIRTSVSGYAFLTRSTIWVIDFIAEGTVVPKLAITIAVFPLGTTKSDAIAAVVNRNSITKNEAITVTFLLNIVFLLSNHAGLIRK